MPLFRGSKNATIVNGEIVATAQDIADAVNDAIAAKNAAEAAEASALNTLDDFDDRYLGAKSSDPTVDNDGDALIDGALYYNTVNLITRVYDLSSDSWSDLKPSSTEQTNINTVAGIADDVTTVAADGADIGTVANNIADVNTTATNISDVQIVAADLNETISEIEVVAGSITDVNSVGSNISDVTTVATNVSDVQTVANDLNETTSDIETVSTNITNVNNVGGNIANVNTVSDISTEVTIVAADGTDIGDVASNINAVDVVASDLAGAGFDYDLGSITGVTEGVVGTPDGFIITVFNIRDDIQTVAGIADDVVNLARTDQEVRDLFSGAGGITYDSATGQFSVTTNIDADTLDGQQGTHYLDRANHTGTQTLSTISDSGALAALNTVNTAQISNQAVTDDKLATSLDLGSI